VRQALELALEALEVATTPLAKDRQEVLRAITAIKEALAQPEQEPVATLDDLEQEIYENTRQFVSRDVMEWMLKRYYTTPPQRTWVGLTDEEIADCAEKMEASDPTDSFWREFFRGIEAKLKEKNT
jgi:hypothetical protein